MPVGATWAAEGASWREPDPAAPRARRRAARAVDYFLGSAAGATQHVTAPSPHLLQLGCVESAAFPLTTVILPPHSSRECLEPRANHSSLPWLGGPAWCESRIMTVSQPLHCMVTMSCGPTPLASVNVVNGLVRCQYWGAGPASVDEANAPVARRRRILVFMRSNKRGGDERSGGANGTRCLGVTLPKSLTARLALGHRSSGELRYGCGASGGWSQKLPMKKAGRGARPTINRRGETRRRQ